MSELISADQASKLLDNVDKRTLKKYFNPKEVNVDDEMYNKNEIALILGVPDMDEPLVASKAVAAHLSMPEAMIIRYARLGLIPAYTFPGQGSSKGRKMFYRISEVEKSIKIDLKFMDRLMFFSYVKPMMASLIESAKHCLSETEHKIVYDVLVGGKHLSHVINDLSRERNRQLFSIATKKISKYVESYERQIAILKEDLDRVKAQLAEKVLTGAAVKPELIESMTNFAELPIMQTDLSIRAKNVIDRMDIITVMDLLNTPKEKITKARNCGKKTVEEIEEFFKEKGLTWK